VKVVFRLPTGELRDDAARHRMLDRIGKKAPIYAGHLLLQTRPRQEFDAGPEHEVYHHVARGLDGRTATSGEIILRLALLDWPPDSALAGKRGQLFSQFCLAACRLRFGFANEFCLDRRNRKPGVIRGDDRWKEVVEL
jgi:hypothetical protein